VVTSLQGQKEHEGHCELESGRLLGQLPSVQGHYQQGVKELYQGRVVYILCLLAL
jgi:hypothetical protein